MAQSVYGVNTRLYGLSDSPYGVPGTTWTGTRWVIDIDWDGDGVYDYNNETFYCIDMDIDRGFSSLYSVAQNGYYNGIAPPKVGTATIKLDNTSKRFSAWNTSSPLYGHIYPGKRICIYNRKDYTGTDRNIFTGYISDIQEDREEKVVTIECVDGINFLKDAEANVQFLEGYSWGTPRGNTGTFIDEVAASINWDGGVDYSSFVISNQMHYYSSRRRAYDEFTAIARAGEGGDGIFYIDAGGVLTFDQLWDWTIGSTNAQTPTTYGADVFLKNIEINQPWENLITGINSYVYRWSQQDESVLWEHGTPPAYVDAGATETFWAELRYENTGALYYSNLTEPTTDDYTANSNDAGSGSDLTASISMTVTNFGDTAKIDVTNSGGTGAYLTTFKLRGEAILLKKNFRQLDTYTDGIYTYLNKRIDAGTQYFQIGTNIPYTTNAFAFLFTGYADYSKVVTLQIQEREEQYLHDLNDLLTFTISDPDLQEYDLPADVLALTAYATKGNRFHIMRIRHKWNNKTGQDVTTTWTCRHMLIY
jgi:hypothetical protein